MNPSTFRVQTSGGVLVGFVVLAVVVFEFRTVLGMIFGVDVSSVVYFLVAVAVLVGFLVVQSVARKVGPKGG